MSSSFNYRTRERVNVYVDVIYSIIDMIDCGCYEQATDTLELLVNAGEREKARTKKQELYYAVRLSKTEAERRAAYRAYAEFMTKTLL